MSSGIIKKIQQGKIGVIPTDTIYGIVGSALNPKTVEKIYKLRKRSINKQFIILVSSIKDLEKFGVRLTDKQREFLQSHWPNPLSVILPANEGKFSYLHRGKNNLAFRMPEDSDLWELLKRVGPLVAPSANLEGEKPATTIEEAKKYFADKVSFYIDGGKIKSQPSTLISLKGNGRFRVLRKGEYKV